MPFLVIFWSILVGLLAMNEPKRAPVEKKDSKKLDDLAIYSLFRDYIKHEDSLTNYRTTWLLTINGFLYGTYGLTLQKMLEVFEKTTHEMAEHVCDAEYLASYTTNKPLFSLIQVITYFLYSLCAIGLVVSLRALLSLWSSYNAVASLREIFELYQQREAYPKDRKSNILLKWRLKWVYPLYFNNRQVKLPLLTGGGRLGGASLGSGVPWLVPLVLMTGWVCSAYYVYNNIHTNFSFSGVPNTCPTREKK